MPLLKRKADGEFEQWSASGSSPAHGAPPPAKRAKAPEQPQVPTPSQPQRIITDAQRELADNPLYAVMVARLGKRPGWPDPVSQPIATTSQPPVPVVKPKPKAKSKEKRQGRYRSSASTAIMQRLQRVKHQRFFMIHRERDGDELEETFSVLGSTGNVYTVVVDSTPRCNCPDFQKGNHCKHIIFIFIKVLQVPEHSPHWYQKGLLTEELEEVFRGAPAAPNAVASERVREAHAKATGKAHIPAASSSSSSSQPKRKIPEAEDDCPICYESMHNQPEAKLTWCEACGNPLHKECFQQWQTTLRTQGKKLTCVFCRADWIVPGGSGAGSGSARVGAGGYLNLSQVAGLSPQRDTSTYYSGPRRGSRYGYDYEDKD